MHPSHLLPWITSRRFEPFVVFLDDGRHVSVAQAESVMLPLDPTAVYLFHSDGEVEVIDVAHITAIRSHGPIGASDRIH